MPASVVRLVTELPWIFIAFSWFAQISNRFALYLSLQPHFLVLWSSRKYIWGRMENQLLGSRESALIQRDFITCRNAVWQSCKRDAFTVLGALGRDVQQTDLSEVEAMRQSSGVSMFRICRLTSFFQSISMRKKPKSGFFSERLGFWAFFAAQL